VGISFLILPPYSEYCESDQANQYNCAAYESVVTIVGSVQGYNGAITALATIFIGLFTGTIYKINRDQLRHTQTIERAYVKLSHTTPGIKIRSQTNFFELTIRVKNHGQTPATITDVLVCPVVLPHQTALPERPVYITRIPKGFLVADDEFFLLALLSTSRRTNRRRH
jgi:hypothetical protein